MGLFDFLGKKSADAAPPKAASRDVARWARLAGNKMAQNYDRQEAIAELAKLGSEDAAAALLKRFDFTMDPGITDQEEKESALEGIVAAGARAIEPIRTYCAKAESLTWPMKVLERVVPSAQLVEEILALLDAFDTEYVRNPEPEIQLITALEAHPSNEMREAVEPFLDDVSEPVRFTAVGTVFAATDVRSVAALVAVLEEEESLRVKNRIAQGLADRAWEIPEALRPACTQGLPDRWALVGAVVRKG